MTNNKAPDEWLQKTIADIEDALQTRPSNDGDVVNMLSAFRELQECRKMQKDESNIRNQQTSDL